MSDLRPQKSTLPVGHCVVCPNLESLAESCCSDLVATSLHAVNQRDTFHIALPGHVEFERLYHTLIIDPRYRALPWERTHVWLDHEGLNDESLADASASESAWDRLYGSLLEHLPLADGHAHRIPLETADPLDAFHAELIRSFAGGPPRVDVRLVHPAAEQAALQPFGGFSATKSATPPIAIDCRRRLLWTPDGDAKQPVPDDAVAFCLGPDEPEMIDLV